MWNSNSIIAWVLARAGLDAEAIQPPSGGGRPDGTPASWSRAATKSRRASASHSARFDPPH